MKVVTPHITGARSPYYDVFTSFYTVETDAGVVLFDCGSFDTDFAAYVQPLLDARGVTRERLRYVFLSHDHEDHAGGLPALLDAYPEVTVLSRSEDIQARYPAVISPENGTRILDVLQVVTIPGHTADSMGLLDTRTGTLLSGDSLQLYGLFGSGEWGANIVLPTEHRLALCTLRTLPIEQVYTAHDYHPYGAEHVGKEAVQRLLNACEQPLDEIEGLFQQYPNADDETIRRLYHAAKRRPTLGCHVVTAMRQAKSRGNS